MSPFPVSTEQQANMESYRLRNNMRFGNDDTKALQISFDPLYAMFNHHCQPSVWLDTQSGLPIGSLGARAEIQAGKEVFVSYFGLR